MKINKKMIVTAVALAGVVLLGIKGKGLLEERKKEVANAALPQVERISVPVVHAVQGDLQKRATYLATLLSDRSVKLSTKLAGYIEKVFVQEAQTVRKGTPLVKIDETEIRSSIEALRATIAAQQNDLAVARSVYKRNQKLYEVGGLAKEKLDLSRAALHAKASQLENSRQKLAQLKHQLSYLKIVAPFDATVDAIFLHEGDLAATGKPILSLSSGEQKLLFSFASELAESIRAGQRVFVDGEEMGKIKSIYNITKNGLATAEVALQKRIALPVGSNLNIKVETAQMQGCSVPSDTLLHKKEGVFVMLYADGRFRPQKVSLMLEDAGKAIISPCPGEPLAQASEVKLAALPAYDHVIVTGVEHE